MNSLDALIAMLILLTSIGLLLGALGAQEKEFGQVKDNVDAKIGAFRCMSIIDGMYASATNIYESEIECFVTNGKIKSTKNGVEKIISTIPKVRKEYFLEVDTLEHYK